MFRSQQDLLGSTEEREDILHSQHQTHKHTLKLSAEFHYVVYFVFVPFEITKTNGWLYIWNTSGVLAKFSLPAVFKQRSGVIWFNDTWWHQSFFVVLFLPSH